MRKRLSWESLVWIIVGVSILSIAILWILNIILYSNSLIDIFDKTTRLNIVKDNIQNIIRNLNTTDIGETDTFYIYKNRATKTFVIYTWSINSQYKYIDQLGNYITPATLASFTGETYSRLLWLEREDTSIDAKNQIIKASIRRLIRKNPNTLEQ